METIMYEDLYFDDPDEYQSGSYGKIKVCYYNNKKYAYKQFKNSKFLNGKRRKLSMLSNINISRLLVPKFWVCKNGNAKNAYLTDFCKGKSFDFLGVENIENKVNKINDSKNLIISMHEEGIIHADLNPSNILYNKEKTSIIDFDTCSFRNYKTNLLETTDYCQEFIKKYGIKPELDIFMFNILTYSLIQDCDYYLVRNSINKQKYGFFDNKYGRKICNSLFLDDDIPNNDFLIDTIDESKFIF